MEINTKIYKDLEDEYLGKPDMNINGYIDIYYLDDKKTTDMLNHIHTKAVEVYTKGIELLKTVGDLLVETKYDNYEQNIVNKIRKEGSVYACEEQAIIVTPYGVAVSIKDTYSDNLMNHFKSFIQSIDYNATEQCS